MRAAPFTVYRSDASQARLRFGSAALVVALVACDPVPSYPVPEQPVVGMIFNEQSGVVTADGQPIVLHTTQADLSVPAGAYPVGTRVTLRLVGSLRMQPEAGESFLTYPIQAVQILVDSRNKRHEHSPNKRHFAFTESHLQNV